MAGRRLLYGGAGAGADASDLNGVLFQNLRVSSSQPSSLSSIFMSGSSSFIGSKSMVSFEDVNGGNKSERSFFHSFDPDDNGDEDLDDYFHQPQKKRRLTADQVQFLENSFEAENKLEPERKVQLAKELGLQPRQIAIWFQNRRARWKTKHLEKDYEALQARFNGLKSDYDNLLKEKDELKAEVVNLTEKLKEKEKPKGGLAGLKRPCDATPREDKVDLNCGSEAYKVSAVDCKQEDLSSAKSDVVDLDSPHYTNGVQSSFLELIDSSYVFEPEQSDSSQDEEDYLSKSLLPQAYMLPKIEDANYPDQPTTSCYFGYPADDQTFGFWFY